VRNTWMEKENDAFHRLECAVADGDWESVERRLGSGEPPVERFPLLSLPYALKLLDDGRLAEARSLLERSMKTFGERWNSEALAGSMALYVCVNLRLGETEDAATAARFLAEETAHWEESAQIPALAWLALGRAGHLIGASAERRESYYESAVVRYIETNQARRGLEAWFEQTRLALRRIGRPPAERRIAAVRQRASWHPEYAPYLEALRLIECETNGRYEEAIEAAETMLGDRSLGGYFRLQLEASRARAALRLRRRESAESIERWVERAKSYSASDVTLQTEAARLMGELCSVRGDEAGATAWERLRESLQPMGIAPEWEPAPAASRSAGDAAPPEPALAFESEPAGSPRPWRVRCFGEFAMTAGDRELRSLPWKRRKAQELFLLLLLRPGHAISREQAMDFLFGELEPGKAANQLYVAVHDGRRALQSALGRDNALYVRDGAVRLHEETAFDVDVEQYGTLVRVADQLYAADPEMSAALYERAAELYADVLPDITWIDWLVALRNDLELTQLRVLRRLSLLAEQSGDLDRAERYAREWLRLSPTDEEACQTALRLLMAGGRRTEAAKLYESFAAVLEREMGIRPLPETRAIFSAGGVRGL